MTDTDVIIVGAGPTGLTLATELCLAGIKPLVLERLTNIREVAKAGGIGGQILNLLRYRELGDLLEKAAGAPVTAKLPFGGIHVDLTELDESPMQVQRLPQPQLEALLQNYAQNLGVEVQRGHEVVGLRQDNDAVHLDIQGPDGPYRISARYVVGCDGVRSRIRDLASIGFPGIVYPEVHRMATVTWPAEINVRDDGDYDVPVDAQAVIVAPVLVTGRYIQLAPAYTEGEKMLGSTSVASYYGPSFMIDDLTYHYPEADHKTILINCHYPIDANSFVLQYGIMVEKNAALPEELAMQIAVALGDWVKMGFEQDVEIWRNKTRIDNPLLVEEDGPVYQLRRWYEQFYVDVAEVTADMVDRFEFELDTTRPMEVWSKEIDANMAARAGVAAPQG